MSAVSDTPLHRERGLGSQEPAGHSTRTTPWNAELASGNGDSPP